MQVGVTAHSEYYYPPGSDAAQLGCEWGEGCGDSKSASIPEVGGLWLSERYYAQQEAKKT